MTFPYLTTEEAKVPLAFYIVCGNEELVGYQLRGSIQVDRCGRLVGGKSHNDLNIRRKSPIDDRLAPPMFVLTHSSGLYSAVGTCFSAAA